MGRLAPRTVIVRALVTPLAVLGLLATASLAALATSAAALASAQHVLQYRGLRIQVPAGWPVYDLSSSPQVCVRFDRHAVYLGSPGLQESCPAHAAGRTEAILIQPADSAAASPALPEGGSSAEIALPAHGLVVTATWKSDPGTVERALGLRNLRSSYRHSALEVAPRSAKPRQRSGRSVPGGVYAGYGFDACSAPTESDMSAWRGAYQAAGIYIGGINMACSQPALSAGWVRDESAAGWHLIPTYVGLQAPNNDCGCAGIDPGSARSEGIAAANDAIAQAQSLGMGRGNPIYFDMEGYNTGGTNTSSVLTFLAAWTQQLHARGYRSGVYSSAGSGMVDLANHYGTSYSEPDDIWFAEWNGNATTRSEYFPNSYWTPARRIHQFSGGVDETHGGVTMNIDGDWLDGATAAAGSAGGPGHGSASVPVNTGRPHIHGSAIQGNTLTESHGSWRNHPTAFGYRWLRCDSSGQHCKTISGATAKHYVVRRSDVGHRIRVQEFAGNGAGWGRPRLSLPTALAVHATIP